MKETIEFEFNGHRATVIKPECPNGKWIWKTEFFRAFDKAEEVLSDMGYTRVYYSVSNMYGSYRAVRLMHDFYLYAVKELGLSERCILFGYSRGGLYAFNFALFYPEYVDKIYLDAPVLDMRSWPPEGSRERGEVYREYGLTPESIKDFNGHPVENFEEFFAHGLPLMLVAGDADELVPLAENGGKMIEYCDSRGIKIETVIKPGCAHHPHSLEDVGPIIRFVEGEEQ